MGRWISTLVAVSLLSAAASAQSSDRLPFDPEEIRALEARLTSAVHAGDREGLERLLAADYVLRGAPDVDRQTWIRNALTLCWGDRSDIEAFRARHYESVVIASFELTFFMDPATCRPTVLRSLVTDVWVREQDSWMLKVRHAGAPPVNDTDLTAQYGVVPLPPPAWEMDGELSVVATGGNTSTRTIEIGAGLARFTRAGRTDVSSRFLTAQADSVTRARSAMVDGRHEFRVAGRLNAFGEASFARDLFAGIEGRTMATGGVAFPLLAVPHSLTVQGGVGMTAERRTDRTTLRFATATGAADYTWSMAPGTDFTNALGFDADLESARNWRAINRAAVTVSLNRVLALRASHALEYRNAPVAGFGRADMRTAVTLVFSVVGRPRD